MQADHIPLGVHCQGNKAVLSDGHFFAIRRTAILGDTFRFDSTVFAVAGESASSLMSLMNVSGRSKFPGRAFLKRCTRSAVSSKVVKSGSDYGGSVILTGIDWAASLTLQMHASVMSAQLRLLNASGALLWFLFGKHNGSTID